MGRFPIIHLALLFPILVQGFQTPLTRLAPPLSSKQFPSPFGRRRSIETSTQLLAFGFDQTVAVASISATAKLLSSIGLGGLAARKDNVLDAAAVSALSRLTYWIFQPAFLLCSVSRTLKNAQSGGLATRYLALMPVTGVLQIGLGAIVGLLLTRFAKMETEEARDVQMCTTFANSGPLPLIFADALFTPALQSQVAALISFYLLVWSPLFWSFGRVILGTYGRDTAPLKHNNIFRKVWTETKRAISPPVLGSILGVVIGAVPVLRQLFFGGFLSPVYGALHTLGTAYLPAALLVLAGSLVQKKTKIIASDDSDLVAITGKNTQISPSLKAIVSIFVSRFVLAPLLSLGIYRAFSAFGWLGPVGSRSRALVSFVLLMEGCMPPAQNAVIMLQLEGLKDRATNMAKLLTLMYGMAVIPVTFLLSGCLAVSGILDIV